MHEFLMENLDTIICLVVIIIASLGTIKFLTKEFALKLALEFCEKAERLFNEKKAGTTKKEYVISELYKYIPGFLKFLITEKEISNIIEKALTKMKETINKEIDENKDNK